MKVLASAALAIALALTTTAAPAQAAKAKAVKPTVLGTAQQQEKEALGLRLLASAPVQAELTRVEDLYRRDLIAQHPSAAPLLKPAADSLAVAAVGYALADDADRPAFFWGTTAEHTWFGQHFPQSFYGIDNPDNIYRSAAVDGQARYVVRGRVKRPGPAQQTFMLFGAIPGVTQTMNAEGHMVEQSALESSRMDIKPDGTFTITVDSDDANGRTNHMKSDPSNRHMVLVVRDTLTDWSTENVVSLQIERVGGPPVTPPMSEAQLAEKSAKILAAIAPYWRNWYYTRIYSIPVNSFAPIWARMSGWGFNALGWFSLQDDEALVVTLAPLGARYLGFQVTDIWGIEFESRHRQGSLTNAQAAPNPDGSYTYVVAARDPGVRNWLDTAGMNAGILNVRWQAIPPDLKSATGGIRSVRVVKLADLKAELPAGTAYVTPAEREALLKARAAAFARRMN